MAFITTKSQTAFGFAAEQNLRTACRTLRHVNSLLSIILLLNFADSLSLFCRAHANRFDVLRLQLPRALCSPTPFEGMI
jgi:hypothetical protein